MMKNNRFSEYLSRRKENLPMTVLLSVSLPLIIFVSFPIDIFCRNLDEFRFSIADFLPLSLLLALGSAVVLFAFLILLPKKVYRIVFPFLLGVSLMLFIQGTYLNGGVLYLEGDDMGSIVSPSKTVINNIIWAAIIFEMIIFPIAFRKESAPRTVMTVLCVILLGNQLITSATTLLTTENAFSSYFERCSSDGGDTVYRLTSYGLTELSDKDNVYVFCVDRFDDDYVDETKRKCPEVFDKLDGFTYFNDNISLYGHTYPSVTYMLTGIENNLPKDRKQYFTDAYTSAKTFRTLKENGYRIGVYTDSYYAYDDALPLCGTADNAIASADKEYYITSRTGLVGSILRISLYRCSPFILKDSVGKGLSSGTCNQYITFRTDFPEYSVDMRDVYDCVSENSFTVSDKKQFSFIHFSGCHGVDYDEYWNKTDDCHDITVSVKNSFAIIYKYLDELKARGLYEDATIIITGDHAAAYSDTTPISGVRITALFVKPKGSSGEPLKYSSAQVSHANLWATIGKSEGIEFGLPETRSVFDVPENEDQTRRYVWHTTESGSYHAYIYEVDGTARSFPNWKLTETLGSDTGLYS